MLHTPAGKLAELLATETTPPSMNALIEEFASDLGAGSPVYVDVAPYSQGRFGYCHLGVAAKIRADGGSRVCGWTIWLLPNRFLTAEFHCCWADPEGHLVDITPKPQGEKRILFAPDQRYGADFNFLRRPHNRLRNAYVSPSRDREIDARIALLSAGRLNYESRRAKSAGLSLRDWILSKLPQDPLELCLDEFVEVMEELHSLTVVNSTVSVLPASARASKLLRRQRTLASAIGL